MPSSLANLIKRYVRGEAMPETAETLRFYLFAELKKLQQSIETIALWVERQPEPPIEELDDLFDVTAPTPQGLDALIFSTTLGGWTNTNTAAWKICAFTADGNGAGDLSPNLSFNVDDYATPASGTPLIERVDEGLYEVTLIDFVVSGVNILDFAIPSITYSPLGELIAGGHVARQAYVESSVPASGTFRIQVAELQITGGGANSEVIAVASDMAVGDGIAVMLFLTGNEQFDAPEGDA
jgi:hypothetical protein